jgi:arginase
MRNCPPISLIGAPTDVGGGHRGASMGPEALRVAGIGHALLARGFAVADRGNLVGPMNPMLPPVDGYRHLAEVVAWNEAVRAAVAAELAAGRLPIVLGGDHCIGIGSITAVAQWCHANHRKLLVLWLDAHADFNTSTITPSGNIHGMPVSCLFGIGPRELTHLGGSAPVLRASEIRQIGIRSVDPGEKRLVKQHGLDIYDMRYVDEIGMKRVMEEALAGIDGDTHVHVSFDVDFLDPAIAPGVGTTVPGGPNYREAQLVMEMIADTGQLGSVDVVELNPAFDDHNRTAILSVDLVESLFGKSTLMRE